MLSTIVTLAPGGVQEQMLEQIGTTLCPHLRRSSVLCEDEHLVCSSSLDAGHPQRFILQMVGH